MSASHVAGNCSTLSKHPAVYAENSPQYAVEARGCHLRGSDGKWYRDYVAGLLSIILGYNHSEVTEAVCASLTSGGPTWSLPHRLEEDTAATICRLVGHPDWAVRFFLSGSDACSAAVRIARAVTGNRWGLSVGYHGWHSDLLRTPPAWGLTRNQKADLHACPYNDLASIRNSWMGDPPFGGSAAVIIEPVTTEEPAPGYLQGLRDLCTKRGALLIADECITGGRYTEWSAMRHYNVAPDLYVFSKALGNGYPLACVVGPREIMRCFAMGWHPEYDDRQTGPVYASGTWSASTMGLAAAQATLTVWEREHVAERLWHTGTDLSQGLLGAILAYGLEDRIRLPGPPYRLLLETRTPDGQPDLALKTAIMEGLCDEGVLIGSGFNLMAAHQEEDGDQTVQAWRKTLADVAQQIEQEGAVRPRGRCVVTPYRQR